MEEIERYRGCLLGLASGDAVGTTLEFKKPGTFEPIDDLVGGGPFALPAGHWTDDTSMALCLAESLVERQRFDAKDQLERYVRWWKDGYLSSTGECFDIGGTTKQALAHFQITGDPFSGRDDERSAGNGAIMRLAPVPMFYARQSTLAITESGQSSRTTHGALLCIDACRYFGALIAGALSGAGKDELLSEMYSPVAGYFDQNPLADPIAAIARGSFKQKEPPQIRGTGFVVDSLEAALWAFHKSEDFRHGCLLAVNLGDDADTTGAVYGQIAGAYYGEHGIPEAWRLKLAMRDRIEALATRLYELAPGSSSPYFEHM